MLLDVLSDRGFSGSHVINERIIPARVRHFLLVTSFCHHVNYQHQGTLPFQDCACLK